MPSSFSISPLSPSSLPDNSICSLDVALIWELEVPHLGRRAGLPLPLTRGPDERNQIRKVLLGHTTLQAFGHEGQAGAGDALDVFAERDGYSQNGTGAIFVVFALHCVLS